jgi:beta-lactamase class D
MQRFFAILAFSLLAIPAQAATLCTLIADARTGVVLVEQGQGCDTPTTPASTFKIPLALMGFDSTTPLRWMDYSVVWYSQAVARELGAARLADYARAFGYGNADFSGDPGKDNGLERSWISSSLKLTPRQQLVFLSRFVTGQLPVSSQATEATLSILQQRETADGWQVLGKTGSAYPRNADGNFNRARGWGWYVGLASKGDAALVFVQLIQDEQREPVSGGLRARDGFLAAWPDLVGAAGY